MRTRHIMGMLLVAALPLAGRAAEATGDERFLGGAGDGYSSMEQLWPHGAAPAGWYTGGHGDGYAFAAQWAMPGTGPAGWYMGGSGDGCTSAGFMQSAIAVYLSWYTGSAGDGHDAAGLAGIRNPLDRDTDGDALPDWWELPHFSGITNAAPGGDLDTDKATEYEEYVALTDPRDPGSVFRITSIADAGGTIYVTFPCSNARVYDLLSRTNLMRGEWVAVSGQTNRTGDAGGSMMMDTTPDGPACCYQIKVRIP